MHILEGVETIVQLWVLWLVSVEWSVSRHSVPSTTHPAECDVNPAGVKSVKRPANALVFLGFSSSALSLLLLVVSAFLAETQFMCQVLVNVQ